MGRLIVRIKENRKDVYCLELDEMNFCFMDDDFSASNSPLQVIDNDNGKIIIGAVGFIRIAQLAMEFMKTLIKKKDYVDYKYIKNKLLPKIIKKIEANHIQTIRDEFGQPDCPLTIVIIANNVAYKIEGLKYVSENDTTFATSTNLETFVRIKQKNGELESDADVFKTIDEYGRYFNQTEYPVIYTNNNDFNVSIKKGDER